MNTRSARRGFTLREMFAVITGICVLLALLVPAIMSAREAARREQCSICLKQLTIGLLNYHDVYRKFPMGARHAGLDPGGASPVNSALGPSWFYGVLPFLESSSWFDQIYSTELPGGPARHEFCATDMIAAGVPLYDCRYVLFHCPSSPLPEMETANGPILLPTYVGIAGGCDIDPSSQDYQVSGSAPLWRTSAKIYRNTYKGTGAASGSIVTSSGMLPPCQHVSKAECTDGSSNAMIVAEQSDWLLDRNPASSKKYHGDPGWTVGGTGPGGGWLSGTRRVDPVPKVDVPGGPPTVWGADCWNITTVRYPPNFKRVMGPTPLPGCSENHGINNPLQSPHPGGLLVGMADGSVEFISEKTALEVLLRLAIRNDRPLWGPAAATAPPRSLAAVGDPE